MAIGLMAVRAVWSTSWAEAALLTALGAVVYMVGLRLTGALGPEELDLLRRTALPGRAWLADWFDPAGAARRAS